MRIEIFRSHPRRIGRIPKRRVLISLREESYKCQRRMPRRSTCTPAWPSRQAGSQQVALSLARATWLHKCQGRVLRASLLAHNRAPHLLCRRHRISLAKVVLFRDINYIKSLCRQACLNLSCESSAFQGLSLWAIPK